jgi:long-chain acyl-CoA synthetase
MDHMGTPMNSKPATLRDILTSASTRFAGKTALALHEGESFTYAEVGRLAAELSTYLSERGVGTGDRVVILAENSPRWGVAYFAVASMGAIAVPVLTEFPPKDIARIVEHSGAAAIVVSRRQYEKMENVPIGSRGVCILLDDWTVIPPGATEEDLSRTDLRRESAMRSRPGDAATANDDAPSPGDVAAIVYTSGTTGYSKGVMLTHGNLVSDAIGTEIISGVTTSDRLLSILPLPHTYESTLGLITVFLVGASVTYLEKPPTAAVLLPALRKVRPTIMLSVPLIIEKIYRSKILPELTGKPILRRLHSIGPFRRILNRIAGRKLLKTFGGALRIFTIGGAPLAPDVELFLREAGFPYAIGYGLTETSPLIAGTGPAEARYRSTGPALPGGTSIRIANPNPSTGEGEIEVKGPTVMKGYYRDPERTAAAFTPDGWFKTGDLGVFDADHYLYIKGRSKNMILGPSGKNIYPEEIEAVINEFDTVRDSLVFEQQNKIVALVHLDYERLKEAFRTSESEIKARANELLAELHRQVNSRVPLSARIHKLIEQDEPFQKTPTQKIKRYLYTGS